MMAGVVVGWVFAADVLIGEVDDNVSVPLQAMKRKVRRIRNTYGRRVCTIT